MFNNPETICAMELGVIAVELSVVLLMTNNQLGILHILKEKTSKINDFLWGNYENKL